VSDHVWRKVYEDCEEQHLDGNISYYDLWRCTECKMEYEDHHGHGPYDISLKGCDEAQVAEVMES
jgi:hypothetical protein